MVANQTQHEGVNTNRSNICTILGYDHELTDSAMSHYETVINFDVNDHHGKHQRATGTLRT